MSDLAVHAKLSMFDPVHLGINETGQPVSVDLVERNMLVAGEPGGGKSVSLNLIVGHAALSPDCRMVLVDGKRVELGPWRACADTFVGPSMATAIEAFEHLQGVMDERYDRLDAERRRKVTPDMGLALILVVIDELAYFSATVGTKKDQERFVALVRDLVARGRAAGIITVAATQRPSADIVPTSLRDLFGYRWAFRCSTEASSDTILGHGWAKRGYCATDIDPAARGVGWLLTEGGTPRRVKSAFLSDAHVRDLADYAAELRGHFLEEAAA